MRVGLDVGYSSVKVAWGADATPNLLQLPVGAGPLERCVVTPEGAGAQGAGREVQIGGKPWIAAVDPTYLSEFTPHLDARYPASDEYLALYYAVLSGLGVETVDCLVTGLPVNQFQVVSEREALRKRLEGRHEIRPGVVVNVNEVVVLPQPAGAFRAHVRRSAMLAADQRFRSEETCLILDPGHFSFDYSVFVGGFHPESSGTTTNAGQAIIRRAAAKLGERHGVRVPEPRLERAILTGRRNVSIGERSLNFWPVIEEVAESIVADNLRKVAGNVRNLNERYGFDLVLLTGGASALFESAVRKVFPESRVVVTPDPVMANARGFHDYALSRAPAKVAA